MTKEEAIRAVRNAAVHQKTIPMRAKYGGRCGGCEVRVRKGEMGIYVKGLCWFHKDCYRKGKVTTRGILVSGSQRMRESVTRSNAAGATISARIANLRRAKQALVKKRVEAVKAWRESAPAGQVRDAGRAAMVARATFDEVEKDDQGRILKPEAIP